MYSTWIFDARCLDDRSAVVAVGDVPCALVRAGDSGVACWSSRRDLGAVDAWLQPTGAVDARPFGVADAERLGWLPLPPVPKRCLLLEDLGGEMEALRLSSSKEELDLRTTHHLPRALPRIESSWLLGSASLRLAGGRDVLADVCGVTEALRLRLGACSLGYDFLEDPGVEHLPVLAWHVMSLTALDEDDAMVAAMQLLQDIKLDSARPDRLTFLDLPPRTALALKGLHWSVAAQSERRLRTSLLWRQGLESELSALQRTLRLRGAAETFNEDAFNAWGLRGAQPCCGFAFWKVAEGCDACARSFLAGKELRALRARPPDWEALLRRRVEIRCELEAPALDARFELQ